MFSVSPLVYASMNNRVEAFTGQLAMAFGLAVADLFICSFSW